MQHTTIQIDNMTISVFYVDGFYYGKMGNDLVLLGDEPPTVADAYKAVYRYKNSKQAV